MTSAEPRGATLSLRLRFIVPLVMWVVLGVGAIWLSATRVFAEHVKQSYHEELEVHVHELVQLTRIGPDGQPELIRPLSDPRYAVPRSGFYWQVTAPGMPALRSASLVEGRLDDEVARSPDVLHTIEQGPTGPAITYGLVQQAPSGEPLHFIISTDQSELDRLVDSFTRELTLWLIALGVLLLVTGTAIISIGLRPLERLGRSIARLRRGDTDSLEGRYPSEIAPLVDDLNTYIRQNGEMIARGRVQAGNLAHSLRTPLAVVMDEAERLAEGTDPKQSAKVLLEQTHMMEQQIEYQLARSRTSAGTKVAGSISRLPDLLVPILGAMRRLHPEIEFTLADEDCEDCHLAVDPVDLSELLSILLDNAGKWAARRVRTAIHRERDGSIEISVVDDGPGMTTQQITAAFEIGTRFDPEKNGAGLGLAIAREIANALGASIDLISEPCGLVARVRFWGSYSTRLNG